MMRKLSRRVPMDTTGLLNRFIGLTAPQKLDLGLAYHAGLFRMERGIGMDEDWGTLAVCIRLGMRFAAKGNGADDADVMVAAHDALMECEARFRQSGRYVFTGTELQAVRVGLTAHDKQMHRTSYHTVSALLLNMHKEIMT